MNKENATISTLVGSQSEDVGAWEKALASTEHWEDIYDNLNSIPNSVYEQIVETAVSTMNELCGEDVFALRKILDCCPFGSPTSYAISAKLDELNKSPGELSTEQ